MTRFKFIDALAVILCLVPFIAWFMLNDALPEKLPIHWNVSGDIDGWTSKSQLPIFISILTAVGVLVYCLLRFITRIDPKRSAQLNEAIASKVAIGVMFFITATNLLILVPKTGSFNVTSIALAMTGLLFTFIGNLMYNVKPNYFIGLRLPWTLEDPDNWKKTHRLAGILWFAGGLVIAAMALILSPKAIFPAFMTVTALLVLVPAIYSFVLFRNAGSVK